VTVAQKSEAAGLVPRVWRFLKKPLHEKTRLLSFRWVRIFPTVPALVRLPFGAWWFLRNDSAGEPLRLGQFETAELAFVQRFLRRGMTVLDLGAHYGLYTLLASKRVGSRGQVIAFEPSPRERKILRFHLGLNLCRNVRVEGLALGDEDQEADLHVVQGSQTGCNSLRPPMADSEARPIRVRVRRLDGWLAEQKLFGVDFVKLDVEGAELSVLKGAEHMLERPPRPVVLAEVQDVRTLPWGYPARDILGELHRKGYTWFCPLGGGALQELNLSSNEFQGNFVAVPAERMGEIEELLTNGNRS
jgi:FkbM family methyltransferase